MRLAAAWAAAAILASSGVVAAGGGGTAGRPHLDLRASPRVGFTPVSVLVVAELKGGQAVEDFYCPGLEWDWGDGSRSAEESDCPPFQAGAKLERFFTARHTYGGAGNFEVKLTMRRATRTVAIASVPIVVHEGVGSIE